MTELVLLKLKRFKQNNPNFNGEPQKSFMSSHQRPYRVNGTNKKKKRKFKEIFLDKIILFNLRVQIREAI